MIDSNLKQTLELLQKSMKPYYDSQEQILASINQANSVISEIMASYNEQYTSVASSLTSMQTFIDSWHSISHLIPNIQDMIPTLNTLSLTLKDCHLEDDEVYVSEELTEDVYDLLDNVQQQVPNTKHESNVKTKRKKLTRSEIITIIGIIVPLLVQLYQIYLDSNSQPQIENNYYIDINVLDENTIKLNGIIDKVNETLEHDTDKQLPK